MTLHQAIIATFAYYNRGQTLEDMVLEMYVDDLSDLDPAACISAYQQYRRNPKNRTFPLPAQVREIVNPGEFISNEVKAREIAGRIVGAISQFGWNNATEAQVYIGPVGWAIVQRHGGWSHLCENTGVTIQPTTLLAQLRDQVEGDLKYGNASIEQSIGAISSADVIQLPAPKRPALSAVSAEPPTHAAMLAELVRTLANRKPEGPKEGA